jgi:hypothetical protein
MPWRETRGLTPRSLPASFQRETVSLNPTMQEEEIPGGNYSEEL